MRFIFRLFSLGALVLATIAGVIDAVQSVAASAVVLTPLAAAFADVWPAGLAGLEGAIGDRLAPLGVDAGAVWLLDQPAFAVCLVLAFLFHLAGYRRRRTTARFPGR